jgi:hypothetical protein
LAMGHCFEFKLGLPDWVLAYLKRSTTDVLRTDKIVAKDKRW